MEQFQTQSPSILQPQSTANRSEYLQEPRPYPLRLVKSLQCSEPAALLLDLDNTLTDTRAWFADFILPATALIATELRSDMRLVNRIFADIARATTLHEYAFVVECIACKLASHRHISHKRIAEVTNLFWQAFAAAHPAISLYPGVRETLSKIRNDFPQTKIIILTDSPEWVALERLHLTGILPLLDGVVAIRTEDPHLRYKGYKENLKASRLRIETKMAQITSSHLHIKMAIPAQYAKPSSAGIELIAGRLDPSIKQLVIVGDKDSKEGLAAQHWRHSEAALGKHGRTIDFVRAHYGNHDLEHPRYSMLAEHIPSLQSKGSSPAEVPVKASLENFSHLPEILQAILSGTKHDYQAA